MLHLQEYLSSLHSPELLEAVDFGLGAKLGINVYHHPSLPLVGFKYSQIDSPNTDPIVRECRGIVLEKRTWKVVAKPFNRFFRPSQFPNELLEFNWSDFTSNTKEDGSLIILYFYDNEWQVNTSGSFGFGEVPFSGMSWRELFWKTVPDIDRGKLDPSMTYIFELCTIYNKVVRSYEKPSAFLLSAFRLDDLSELTVAEADQVAHEIHVNRPETFHFTTMDEIDDLIKRKSQEDETWEGVVIRDNHNRRFKCKSESYDALHHLFDNGNLVNPKRIVPLLLAGATKALAKFPELTEHVAAIQANIDQHYDNLVSAWRDNWMIENQKDFALKVKDVPFANLLFTLRRQHGKDQTEDQLKEAWRSNADGIVKRLYS